MDMIKNRAISWLWLCMLCGVGQVWAAEQYRIVKVESWDTLNLRSAPGSKASVITKIPPDASGITLHSDTEKKGKTTWVKITWGTHTGWVSKMYLAKMSETTPVLFETDQAKKTDGDTNTVAPVQGSGQDKPVETPKAGDATKDGAEVAGSLSGEKPAELPPDNLQKEKVSGMWILECGNISPFWKVEVLPEWLNVSMGNHETGMLLTYKRQKQGKRRHVALKTELKGANRWNRLEMTLTYTRSCQSTLVKRKVTFAVEGQLNGEAISGCCRALQVK